MENPKTQLLERLKTANNVLVTVSQNPSVDQLSAAIGLTLMLNKMGKHATAVYSGKTPSTIEFLQPDKTLEKNTDSLRDFIIALDKSKADKLRYKVEDSHVKIFITPYRTSITDKDLDFSQGDFNVEVVIALGVNEQRDLDQAITSHGRILHDATTASVTNGEPSTLGTINWADKKASSLCEMVAGLIDSLQPDLLDGQMATALMTGIVAETSRFSNEKTSPTTMSISAALMASGANQQLVASKLQEDSEPAASVGSSQAPSDAPAHKEDGSLEIDHANVLGDNGWPTELPEPVEKPVEQVHIDEEGNVQNSDPQVPEGAPGDTKPGISNNSSLILEPPTLGGRLTANSEPEPLDPSTDPLGTKDNDGPILSHQDSMSPTSDSLEPLGTNDSVTVPESPLPPAGVSEPPQLPTEEPDPLAPSMDLPSESPLFTTLPTPSEQSIKEDLVTAPAEEAPALPTIEDGPQTLSDLEAAVKEVASPVEEVAADVTQSVALSDIVQPAGPPSPVPSMTPAETPDLSAGLNQDQARGAVMDAFTGVQQPDERRQDSGIEGRVDLDVKETGETGMFEPLPPMPDLNQPDVFTMPENLVPPINGLPTDPTASGIADPTKAPDLPPPLPPGVWGPSMPPAPTVGDPLTPMPSDNGQLPPPVPGQNPPDQQSSDSPPNVFGLPPG